MNKPTVENRTRRSQAASFGLCWLLSCMAAGVGFAQEANRTLIRAKKIITVDEGVIENGEVLIIDGKLEFVGKTIELAEPAETIEVDTLMPGMINASSSAGIVGGAERSREITPDFATLKSIDWDDRDFAEALDAGVTTVQILPDPEAVFAGFSCVVKTGGTERVVTPEKAVLLAICSDPTSGNRSRSRPDSIYVRQPTNRMGVVWIIRNALHQAQLKEAKRLEHADPRSSEILDKIVGGEIAVLTLSRKDFDIRSALMLGRQYNFAPTVYGGDEVYRMIDEFKSSGASLVFTALTSNSSARGLRGNEGTDLRWNVPGRLHEAKIPFCLAGRNLLDQAQFAHRFGLPAAEAIKAVTLAPAKLLGIDSGLGSITVGKQADLVGLTGDPLRPTSRVEWTMINGQIFGDE